MNSVVHFEIQAENPEKLAEFYKAVFDWKVEKWDNPAMDYWMAYTRNKDGEHAINGGIMKRNSPMPKMGEGVNAFVCTMGVDNIDEALAKLEKAGGKIAMPKTDIPTVGSIAYGIDTDGNMFGIIQPVPMEKKM